MSSTVRRYIGTRLIALGLFVIYGPQGRNDVSIRVNGRAVQ